MPIEQTTRSDSALQGHTPGPWFQDETGIFGHDDRWPDWQVASLGCPDMLCGLDPSEYPIDVKRAIHANARLIAAAPELLSQLEYAVKLLGAFPALSGTAQVRSMRETIAKARGAAGAPSRA